MITMRKITQKEFTELLCKSESVFAGNTTELLQTTNITGAKIHTIWNTNPKRKYEKDGVVYLKDSVSGSRVQLKGKCYLYEVGDYRVLAIHDWTTCNYVVLK